MLLLVHPSVDGFTPLPELSPHLGDAFDAKWASFHESEVGRSKGGQAVVCGVVAVRRGSRGPEAAGKVLEYVRRCYEAGEFILKIAWPTSKFGRNK